MSTNTQEYRYPLPFDTRPRPQTAVMKAAASNVWILISKNQKLEWQVFNHKFRKVALGLALGLKIKGLRGGNKLA